MTLKFQWQMHQNIDLFEGVNLSLISFFVNNGRYNSKPVRKMGCICLEELSRL